MESERTQDEQTLPTEQEETNTPAAEQSDTEETSQEVVSENVQNENDLTINEFYDQAPVTTCSKEPDVGGATKTTVTTEPLLSSLNKTNMKFFVRNLEGHNDVICDVACRGSVLVSGGYVNFPFDIYLL